MYKRLGAGKYHLSEFLSGMLLYGSSTGIAQFMMMVYAMLVARALGPDNFGAFSGSYAVTGLTAFCVNLGMDTWYLREGARCSNPRALTASVLKIKFFAGLVWGSALFVLVPLIRPGLFPQLLLIICIIDVWSDQCFNTLVASLNVQKRVPVISRLILFSRGGRLVGTVLIIIFKLSSPVHFAFVRGLFTIASFFASLLIVRPVFLSPERPSREIIRKTLPYGLSEFFALIYVQADVTLLALMSGRVATGTYSPASGLINALFIIPSSGYVVAIPILSRLIGQNSDRFRAVSLKLIASFIVIGIILGAGVALSGKWIVGIVLGESFQETGTLLVVLSPILFLKSVGFACAAILVAINWQTPRLFPQIISASANVIFNILVIPVWGVLGVAVVYVFSEILLTIGYIALVVIWYRKFRITSL